MNFLKRKKLTSKKVAKLNRLFACLGAMLYLVIGLIMVIHGSYMFHTGFHSLDLAQNMDWLNAEYDLELVDIHSDGIARYSGEMYINGINYLHRGFFVAIIGTFLLGISFTMIPYLHDVK